MPMLPRLPADRAAFEMQRDVAAKPDRAADICSWSDLDGSSACRGCRLDGFVNGGAVERFPVAFGAESFDLERRRA
jgi:hypothetical protein